MILICPSCGTRFAVDARAIGAVGRRVKCSRCAEVWFTEADPAELAALADVLPPPSPTIRVEPRPIPPGSGLPALRGPQPPPERSLLGWPLFAAVVLLMLVGGWLGRSAIVGAWPPAARLYAAVGIPVEAGADALELAVAPARRQNVDGVATIIIEGTVRNRSHEETAVPLLRAVARATDGAELYGWTFNAERPRLKPGETSSFTTRLDRPVAGAADIAVTLAEAEPPASARH
jgi:predicted Zn finger-like uncharacterized protein